MSSAQVRTSSVFLSYTCRDAYHAASSYFHLPIDEEEDEDDFIPPSTRHISWDSSDTTLIDPDTPSSIPSFPFALSGHVIEYVTAGRIVKVFGSQWNFRPAIALHYCY